MKRKDKIIIAIILCLTFSYKLSFSQNPWSEEKVLWTCPNNPNLKITYRINSLANQIEINGPIDGSFFSDKKIIPGVLKINSGSFKEPERLDPQVMAEAILANKPATTNNSVQSIELKISGLYSENFLFFPEPNKIPEFSFEGTCGDNSVKTEVELSEMQTKKILDLFFGAGASKDLTINNEDKKQALNLFKKLIEGSCEIAIVQNISNLDATLLTAFKMICKSIGDCNKLVKDGSYSETVRKTLSYSERTHFDNRRINGEWL